jgi:hypothetical protein
MKVLAIGTAGISAMVVVAVYRADGHDRVEQRAKSGRP